MFFSDSSIRAVNTEALSIVPPGDIALGFQLIKKYSKDLVQDPALPLIIREYAVDQ
jgi:hypothetical protein